MIRVESRPRPKNRPLRSLLRRFEKGLRVVTAERPGKSLRHVEPAMQLPHQDQPVVITRSGTAHSGWQPVMTATASSTHREASPLTRRPKPEGIAGSLE